MPFKLSTTVSKITSIPNQTNVKLVSKFLHYMQSRNCSERHQNNNLQVLITFAHCLGPSISFYNIEQKEQILAFLDTKKKSVTQDPDQRWITTWNHNLTRIKQFFRWLANSHDYQNSPESEWITPAFAQIKEKKSIRKSPYSEIQIWEREDLLTVVKYEPEIRNKAILTLLWDLDARNHEITELRIGNIRFQERYAEGEIPHNTKTGGGPFLLACSFPYVRDWLNKHPFKNTPEARLICNLQNGAPIKPDSLCTVMKQLRHRITQMLESGIVNNLEEKQKLEYLLRTKKWNPYCLRHSAITYDSDYLPEYAVKKKARWSMNSRQGSRYIKSRMGGDLKRAILAQNGIALGNDEALRPKPAVRDCPRCNLINACENKYCSKCSYPLIPQAYEEIKVQEDERHKAIEQKYEQDMKAIREEMNHQFSQIMLLIQQNPGLAHIKPEILSKKIKE
jgi:integrase/recombinase XerD